MVPQYLYNRRTIKKFHWGSAQGRHGIFLRIRARSSFFPEDPGSYFSGMSKVYRKYPNLVGTQFSDPNYLVRILCER